MKGYIYQPKYWQRSSTVKYSNRFILDQYILLTKKDDREILIYGRTGDPNL